MATTIAEVVRQFKADVGQALSADTIRGACKRIEHSWRERELDPVTTVHLFMTQILHGNISCCGLRRVSDLSASPEAYCKARKRLPLALFQNLLQGVADAAQAETRETGLWRGHRTWTMDGTNFSMPDTPALQSHFGQPSAQAAGCGFPQAHVMALFHAGTGLLMRVAASPMRTHDMSQAAATHPAMAEGDILVADRGLASFAHLALISQRKMHAVFRCHQKQIVDFRPGRKHTTHAEAAKGLPRSRWIERLGTQDQLVEYFKPAAKPEWMDAAAYAALPDGITVREIRFATAMRGRRTEKITVVTTLLDPVAYPAKDIAALYKTRWQIEVDIRHLKTTMGMEVLHCKTVDGVLKELCVYAIVYNLVRLVMGEAARRQKVPAARISFVDVLRWLRTAEPGTPLPEMVVNPDRPDRYEPRVLKRRPKAFKLMMKPREILKKALGNKKLAA